MLTNYLTEYEYKNPDKGKIRNFNKQNKKKAKKSKQPIKYIDYIRSKCWKNRKNQYFVKYGKKCCICNSTKDVQVHHTYYNQKHDGNEPDEQLVPFCIECHQEFHMTYGVNANMEQQTVEFILEKTLKNYG